MKCLRCNSSNLKKQRVPLCPEIKGVKVEVVAEAIVCQDCNNAIMDSSMMNELRRAAADKYRSDNELHTSKQK